MLIMGIDPGSLRAGYGLLEVEGRAIKYLDSGVLRYDHIDHFLNRPTEIYQSIADLFRRYRPEEVAFEGLVMVKGTTSMLKLAQARGAMLAALSGHLPNRIFEYAPNLVKSSLMGHGHAAKENIQKGLRMIFPKEHFATNDESDALAVALCHALHRGQKGRGP